MADLHTLYKFLVEEFTRKIEPSTVLDIGWTDSEYIPFLFAYVGSVQGTDIRFGDNTHKFAGMLQCAYDINFRYFPDGYKYDLVTCTNYLARCGVMYESTPDTPFVEQRKLFMKLVDVASKGALVTLPFSKVPEQREVKNGQFIYDKNSLSHLLDFLKPMPYTVDVTYFKDSSIVSPQIAETAPWDVGVVCAIEVMKRRF